MNDFEDKLNAILSNPDAMAQVMNLAQSLGSTMSASPQTQRSDGTHSDPVSAAPRKPTDAGDDLFSLFDPALIGKFLPLLSELNHRDGDERLQLLLALRPFLKPERQDKVERAVKAARLIHIGKKLFMTMGETNV